MYILDTDHVTLLQRGVGPDAARLLARVSYLPSSESIATSIITYEEQTRGWLAFVAKSRSMQEQVYAYSRLERHIADFRQITIAGFDDRAAVEFQRLRSGKHKCGTMDLKIAAIALSRKATLLTRNTGDFLGIPGLNVEDWTK